MKTLIISSLLLLLLCRPNGLSAQYKAVISNDTVSWTIFSQFYWDSWGPFDKFLSMAGDSTVNSFAYKKVYANCYSDFCNYDYFVGLLREDSTLGRVWYWPRYD
ncbi:MAG: hypothetical protein AAFN10_21460, partial [Bacteroidota bacterium]